MNNPEIKAIVVAIHRTRINEANKKTTQKNQCAIRTSTGFVCLYILMSFDFPFGRLFGVR
jgi:hypothetical protein